MAMTKREVRMPADLWKGIEKAAREFGRGDKRGDRSFLIRDILSDAIGEWHHSPYVALSADHFIYVSRDGTVFYRAVHRLRLNSFRKRLPALLEQKVEKRRYFEKNRPSDSDRSSWFQGHWLANYFAVWDGDKVDARQFLDDTVDDVGLGSKSADLLVRRPRASILTREVVVVLRDYVQWKGDLPGNEDRADIPIDFPTRDLSISIIVDEALYAHSGRAHVPPPLNYELRNREAAKFIDTEVISKLEYRPEFDGGYYPLESKAEAAADVTRAFHTFRKRLAELCRPEAKTANGMRIVKGTETRFQLSGLELPRRFLFAKMDWPTPHLGINACINWEKPKKQPV